MHKWSKEIAEYVKTKVCARGLNNIQLQELEEISKWAEFTSNMAKTEYYCKVIEAMDGEKDKMRKGYWREPSEEMYRDMDASEGRMYFSNSEYVGRNYGGNGNSSNNRGYTESRYERARRSYEEAKQMNPSTDNLKEMEKIFETFKEDLRELMPKMSSNEKSIARNRLSEMASMM